jgi:hypothetical protein
MRPININVRRAFKWFDVNARSAVSLISKAHRYETNNANMMRFALAWCEKNLINLIQSVTILTPVSYVWVTNMWVQIGESVYWFFTNCNYNVLLHFQDCCSTAELPWMTSSLRILAMEIIPLPLPADYHSTGEPSTNSHSITCLQDNYSAAWTMEKTHFPFYCCTFMAVICLPAHYLAMAAHLLLHAGQLENAYLFISQQWPNLSQYIYIYIHTHTHTLELGYNVIKVT